MPVHSFFHWTEKQGPTLAESGPVIPVSVGIPTALAGYLAQNNLAIPAPKVGFALIDTGAFATAVDLSIFQDLGVQQIDTIRTTTPHGEESSPVYPANISFPALQIHNLPMERIVGCSLKWKTVDEKEIIMLLGRDLLKYFLLIYNGVSSDVTLSY